MNRGTACFVLLGEDELKKNKLIVKDLRNKSQNVIDLDKDALLAELKAKFE